MNLTKSLLFVALMTSQLTAFADDGGLTPEQAAIVNEPAIYHVGNMSGLKEAIQDDAKKFAAQDKTTSSRDVLVYVGESALQTGAAVVVNYQLAKPIYGGGDKALHQAVGGGIYCITYKSLKPHMNKWAARGAALLVTAAAGVGKEVYDKHTDGTVDRVDAEATILGGLVGSVICF